MTGFPGFPADVSLAMLALAAAYFLLAHLPVWLATLYAFWPGRLQRKLAFICISSAITYGLLVMAVSLVAIPLEALSVYVLPEWQMLGYDEAFPPLAWLAACAGWIGEWWFAGWPLLSAGLGWIVVTRLARRWNMIVALPSHQASRRCP